MIPKRSEFLERAIAGLLWYGTWLATGVILFGFIIDIAHQHGAMVPGADRFAANVMKSGIALFILLPIARVGLMLGVFLRQRDYTYAAISALVLIIIAVGVTVES